MSIDPQRMIRPAAVPDPVPPALIVKIMVRPLTRLLNPLIRKLAGRRHFRMAAQIWHAGRRSGRLYMAPAGARLAAGAMVIPLTFGNESDWSRNVRAAGGCFIRLDGQDYRATTPEFLGRRDADAQIRAAFSPLERASFRLLGIKQFLRLQATAVESLPVG